VAKADLVEVRKLLVEFRSDVLGRHHIGRSCNAVQGIQEASLLARIQRVIETMPPPAELDSLDKDMRIPVVRAALGLDTGPCTWCKGTGVAHDANMVPGETAECPCPPEAAAPQGKGEP
jgi:hypothetical protein